MAKGRVYVGLSGGVDSAVSAALLLEAGYDVLGCFIKVWQPPFLTCSFAEDRQDALRVAAFLGIPFRTFDFADVYKKEVVEYLVREYASGRTPNPDVFCNTFVKFGAFFDAAEREGATHIATGHYARVGEEGGTPVLCQGSDPEKDQSYFLWTLTPRHLKKILFPVGHLYKRDVRTEALRRTLPVAKKRESQGLCFLGKLDIGEFLAEFIDLRAGDVLNEVGEVVGEHQGAVRYTLGQRHGFTVRSAGTGGEPHYVISKDVVKNTITVASRMSIDPTNSITLVHVNWPTGLRSGRFHARARHRETPFLCELVEAHEDAARLRMLTARAPVAPGQSVVIYEGDRVIAGGIVS